MVPFHKILYLVRQQSHDCPSSIAQIALKLAYAFLWGKIGVNHNFLLNFLG
jgi:hypothetical protein